MSPSFSDKLGDIKIVFPQKEFDDYLQRSGASSVQKITFSQAEEIFLLAANDFKSGKLSLDGFSAICGCFWDSVLKKHYEKHHTDLGNALYAGGELSYYIRRTADKHAAQGFVKLLNEVLDFVEKRKN